MLFNAEGESKAFGGTVVLSGFAPIIFFCHFVLQCKELTAGRKMKKFLQILFYCLAALYPILLFSFLVIFHLPVRLLSICVIVLAAVFFMGATGKSKSGTAREKFDKRPLITSVLFFLAGVLCFITNKTVFLKLYSVVVSASFLFVFGSSLFFPPPIVFRFATLKDKSILTSPTKSLVERYCRTVTKVWCAFFIANGTISALTAMSANDTLWSVYNGGVSYVLMGLLFSIEYIIRRKVNAKMPKVSYITDFTADSRSDDFVLCYEGKWSDGTYKTWRDFLTATAKMRHFIAAHDEDEWILHCEDYWYFLVTFVSLLQCKKAALLTQNISSAFLSEIKTDGRLFLTDQTATGGFSASNSSDDRISIADIIEGDYVPSEAEIRDTPAIDSDATRIVMYTSGSTGKPKAVRQRMTEFQKDNAFILQKWGAEFFSRKLVTTVSQHHIYGFLFGISLPFAAGVPFRRTRIEFPEEFEALSDESYMIIAVPAFLKRTVDIVDNLSLKNPWIFTSGGVLLPEVAKRTNEVFGFWPVEVYGSTETSGIAYRQSKNGLEWTAFDNAKVWRGDDGCLRIISPYIKDPAGFATADLVEILDDGRFLLKGRADSIVKIEEKRISMTEVENRLLQTGLVSDVKVIALEDRRQYLAAALVLNEAGKAHFADKKKFLVNQYFHDFLMQFFENVVIPKRYRYLDALPTDTQGKKHKEDIKALFETTDEEKNSAKQGENE